MKIVAFVFIGHIVIDLGNCTYRPKNADSISITDNMNSINDKDVKIETDKIEKEKKNELE
jgi:hypothetical protein